MAQTLSYVFMGGFGLLLIVLAVLQKMKAKKAAESWPTTSGTVEKSELSVSHDTDSDGTSSTTYSAHVVYSYKVGGVNYKNDSIGFGKSSGGRKKAEKKLAEYPAGRSVTVYYDPDNATKAVLEPVATTFGLMLTIGIILIVLGVVVGLLVG